MNAKINVKLKETGLIKTNLSTINKVLFPYSSIINPNVILGKPSYMRVLGQSINLIADSGWSALQIAEVVNWKDHLIMGGLYYIETTNGFELTYVIKKGHDKEHFNIVPLSSSDNYVTQSIPKTIIKRIFAVLRVITAD